jgi:acetylornithine deacetylase/succinyl-diaminopimelate desuccinylase-like protein
MTRDDAISRAQGFFDSGTVRQALARRVAMPTESQNPQQASVLVGYLDDELRPAFEALGFTCHIAKEGGWPFLLAERMEDANRPTVLGYGHGDVVRGVADQWAEGLSPWVLTDRANRWYGRGVADNKGQHSINIAALQAVLETRGRLGFNAKFLIEMGEEVLSPGLREFAAAHREALAADVFIASDGPRLSAHKPTIFLGARGSLSFDLTIVAREGGHHPGNWGGLLSDPAIRLANAIAVIAGPNGAIQIPEWVPGTIPDAVRAALAECDVGSDIAGPEIDRNWGEPGLTPAERVFGWSSFTVLAIEAGTPAAPANAIPPRAWARCQLRFVVGVDEADILPALRRHLDRHGMHDVTVTRPRAEFFRATRLDPRHPWAVWVAESLARTTGTKTVVLPNLGGSLPNDIFSDLLGLPTIWVPHSYPGCSQHAPNEHLPVSIVREGLGVMAGLYFDLGELEVPLDEV